MIKAKDIMTKELISVSPETEITKAAIILLEKGIIGKEDVLRTLMSSAQPK